MGVRHIHSIRRQRIFFNLIRRFLDMEIRRGGKKKIGRNLYKNPQIYPNLHSRPGVFTGENLISIKVLLVSYH